MDRLAHVIHTSLERWDLIMQRYGTIRLVSKFFY